MVNKLKFKPFELPQDFLLGTATSSFQIEGGDKNNTWYDWCKKGHIKDDTNCIRACDFWNKYEEDINILKTLNQKTFRLGIEWSRIEPEEGQFDKSALAHYRNIIGKLKDNNILPLVTLHHFSNPLWLENQNGWESTKIIYYFLRYVELVVNNLKDLVNDWVTINEPNIFSYFGYVEGLWPPGKKNAQSFLKVVKNLIISHIEAYKIIHSICDNNNSKAKVGVAHHIRVFNPNINPLSIISCYLMNYMFNDIFLEGMTTGKLLYPLQGCYYEGEKGNYADYIGINYYSRNIVKFVLNPKNLFGRIIPNVNCKVNDLGWEIYPKGISIICKKIYKKYKKEIFITENGIADNRDKLRSEFIYSHLYEISRLINNGIPIKRYYYWSYIDNFELLEGESCRFGLVYNDFETQKRTIKNSGFFYSEICKENKVTSDIINKYLKRDYN